MDDTIKRIFRGLYPSGGPAGHAHAQIHISASRRILVITRRPSASSTQPPRLLPFWSRLCHKSCWAIYASDLVGLVPTSVLQIARAAFPVQDGSPFTGQIVPAKAARPLLGGSSFTRQLVPFRQGSSSLSSQLVPYSASITVLRASSMASAIFEPSLPPA